MRFRLNFAAVFSFFCILFCGNAVSLDHAVYGFWITLAKFCGFFLLLNAIAEKTFRVFACILFGFAVFDLPLRPPLFRVLLCAGALFTPAMVCMSTACTSRDRNFSKYCTSYTEVQTSVLCTQLAIADFNVDIWRVFLQFILRQKGAGVSQ